jgi:hypothetical protein
MKKTISIISLLITTGILLSSLFVLTQFNLKGYGYSKLADDNVTQIQKLITNNPTYFSEEYQRSYEIRVDMKEVNEELLNRYKIISKSKKIIELVIFGISILFIINIYNLVIAFRNEEK